MINRNLIAAVAIAAVAFTACGGGSSSSSIPAPAKTSGSGGVGQLAFKIVIPAATAATLLRRKPAYVSPATQSVTFQIGSGTPQVVPLTLGSATCPSNGNGGYICTANANVTAGANQTLTIKTFASTDGSGTALSQNTAVITVVAAQSNPVTVSLNGIAAALSVAVSPTSSVSRCTPATLTATWTAQDAAGYTIVGPGTIETANGTPVAPTLTTSDPTHFTIGALTGNSWPVTYNGAGGGASTTLSATFAGVTTGTAPVTINAGSLLFAKTAAGVIVLAPPYTGTATVISNGVNNPSALLVDASCTLYVANYGTGGYDSVTTYAPPYTGAPVTTTATFDAFDIALGSNGNLFILSTNPSYVVQEYAPPFVGYPNGTTVASFNVGNMYCNCQPQHIVLNSANDAFVTNDVGGTNEVLRFPVPYTYSSPVPTSNAQRSIIQPVTDNLFTVNSDTSITQIVDAPNYSNINTSIPPGTNSGGSGLALDPSGNLFVSYATSATVVEYAPPYTNGATTTITAGVSTPVNVAVDQATRNLFVANASRIGTITIYAPPYTGAPLATAVVGPQSNGVLAISP